MTATQSLEVFVGGYGPDYTAGVLSEHVGALEAAGFTAADVTAAGYPIVCSELIEIATEDGPATGRCGLPVDADGWACAGHAAEMAGWRAMTEAEKVAWEKEQEQW